MFQWTDRRILWAIVFLFITLRLIYVGSTYLWIDDMATLASINFVPWSELPQVIFEHAHKITGPIIPTLLDGVVINIFGSNIAIIRLLSVFVSVMSLLLLDGTIKRLFPKSTLGRWIPLLLFTFSVPSIIYAQQIQPTIYYFFATIAQVYIFIVLFNTKSMRTKNIYLSMLLFILVTSILFFMNYMSLLQYLRQNSI